jgi:cytochrome c oxidase subunit IV
MIKELWAISSVKIWGLLFVLTCGSFLLGSDHGLGAATRTALCMVLVIAVVKARLVGSFFMDLRRAPPIHRNVVDAWLLITGATVIGMYLGL